MNDAELEPRSPILQSLTDLNAIEFEALLPNFGVAEASFEINIFERDDRFAG